MRNIRQNLVFAFIYNVAGVPGRRGRALSGVRLAAVAPDRGGGHGVVIGQRDHKRPAACPR
jgi:hypothetical protein